MEVKLEGLANITEDRVVHPEKALCPIEDTVLGTDIEVSLLQLWKA